MTGARDITRLRFSSNLAGNVANKIKQSFYSVYSYSGIESIKHALNSKEALEGWDQRGHFPPTAPPPAPLPPPRAEWVSSFF